jgi:hypothetical protein
VTTAARNVFQYAAAATAGYAVTYPLANWIGQWIARLFTLLLVCLTMTILCGAFWLHDGDRYSRNYAIGFAIGVLICSLLLGSVYLLCRRLAHQPKDQP